MPIVILKFLHIGSMFLATGFAVGPSLLLYLVARTNDVWAIRLTFGRAAQVFRASRAFYGLGLIFGFAAALAGTLDLTAPWLLVAYILVALLLATDMVFERWTRRILNRVMEAGVVTEPGVYAPADLSAGGPGRAPLVSVAAMVTLTLLIVFVMVVKPSIGA